MADQPTVFVSYARSDREPVQAIVRELESQGVKTWVDSANLLAGEDWRSSIESALRSAKALLVFISPESMRSTWTVAEFRHAAVAGAKIIPVLLRQTDPGEMPPDLARIQWIDVARYPQQDAAKLVADEIVKILAAISGPTVGDQIGEEQQQGLAKALAAQSRGSPASSSDESDSRPPDSVFIVHGHDTEFLRDVEAFVRSLDITPIVMKDVGGSATSLIQKFFEIGGAARYAIVLLSGDDYGVARFQYEEQGVGEKALQYRARQNVILEMGFFYGLLGWENVFVLERAPQKVFPNFERPSDLNGVLFDRYDGSGKWRAELHRRLRTHGFRMSAYPE